MKILFVCRGNACRSPMAEAIGKRLAGDKAEIRSAGTEALPWYGAADVAIEIARRNGDDLSEHRTKKLTEELVQWADIIYVPTQRRYLQVTSMFPHASAKVAHLDGPDAPFPDPLEAEFQVYIDLYDRLKRVIATRFKELGLI